MPIPTYIINLRVRTDRKANIEREFWGRNEFNINIIEACEHNTGAIGLWESIKKIVNIAAGNDLDYFLLCEDDHQFTETYNHILLKHCIDETIQKEAKLLCGGVSWFEDGFAVSKNLFWAKKFSGLQFTIIFKELYDKILSASFNESDAADYKISSIATDKYFIHPFISTQKEFGYSDVTSKNNQTGRIEELFTTTERNAAVIRRIVSFYERIQSNEADNCKQIDFDTLTIPTYIINLPGRREPRRHILDQFKGRKEFDVNLVNACKHDIGAIGLWQSYRKVINIAIDNDDDVIIICQDDHEFTSNYSKELLLKNIIQAHEQGCDYLNCGTEKFDFAIPISINRLWVNHCVSTKFIVLYREFFQKILDENHDNIIAADIKLSEITDHKMILYPFISRSKDFKYTNTSTQHNKKKRIAKERLASTETRLDILLKAFNDLKPVLY